MAKCKLLHTMENLSLFAKLDNDFPIQIIVVSMDSQRVPARYSCVDAMDELKFLVS